MTEKDKAREENWRTGKKSYVMCVIFILKFRKKEDKKNHDKLFFKKSRKRTWNM